MRGQAGFFDLDERLKEISAKLAIRTTSASTAAMA